MADRETNVANFFTTTLTAEMNATALTAQVATTVGGPASPCYLVIEPNSASQREVVYFDDTFTGTTFVTTVLGNRYLSGSAAGSGLTHPSGSVVWATPLKQHIEDLNDRIDANTPPTTEAIQDIVGAMFSGNTETGVTVTYQDADGTIDVEATATDEYIQDLVGAMFSGNTETGITATYQDADGTIDLEVAAGAVSVIRKTSTESVTSSTSLQADDALTVAVAANKNYVFQCFMLIDGAQAGDIKVAFSIPASATLAATGVGAGTNVTGTDPISMSMPGFDADLEAWNFGTAGTGTHTGIMFFGTILTAGTAGNLAVHWAQTTSSATATRVFAGSWLRLEEDI